jgi:hypothetical protein
LKLDGGIFPGGDEQENEVDGFAVGTVPIHPAAAAPEENHGPGKQGDSGMRNRDAVLDGRAAQLLAADQALEDVALVDAGCRGEHLAQYVQRMLLAARLDVAEDVTRL